MDAPVLLSGEPTLTVEWSLLVQLQIDFQILTDFLNELRYKVNSQYKIQIIQEFLKIQIIQEFLLFIIYYNNIYIYYNI